MRLTAVLSCALFLAAAACSGEDSPGSASPADSGSDSSPDAGGDALVEAGPCEPLGNWTWSFQAEAGAPKLDHVLIEAAPDAGAEALKVTFLDREVPKEMCMPPADGGSDGGADAGPELIDAPATLDAATCTLKVGYSVTWCYSGEDQCESWDISLALSGNGGSGTATEIGGWCMDKQTTSYAVTATKP